MRFAKRESALGEGQDWVATRKKKEINWAKRTRRRGKWARRVMVQVLFLCRLSSLIVKASGVGLLGGRRGCCFAITRPWNRVSYIPSSRDGSLSLLLLLSIMHANSYCDQTAPAAACMQVAAFKVTSWFHLRFNSTEKKNGLKKKKRKC